MRRNTRQRPHQQQPRSCNSKNAQQRLAKSGHGTSLEVSQSIFDAVMRRCREEFIIPRLHVVRKRFQMEVDERFSKTPDASNWRDRARKPPLFDAWLSQLSAAKVCVLAQLSSTDRIIWPADQPTGFPCADYRFPIDRLHRSLKQRVLQCLVEREDDRLFGQGRYGVAELLLSSMRGDRHGDLAHEDFRLGHAVEVVQWFLNVGKLRFSRGRISVTERGKMEAAAASGDLLGEQCEPSVQQGPETKRPPSVCIGPVELLDFSTTAPVSGRCTIPVYHFLTYGPKHRLVWTCCVHQTANSGWSLFSASDAGESKADAGYYLTLRDQRQSGKRDAAYEVFEASRAGHRDVIRHGREADVEVLHKLDSLLRSMEQTPAVYASSCPPGSNVRPPGRSRGEGSPSACTRQAPVTVSCTVHVRYNPAYGEPRSFGSARDTKSDRKPWPVFSTRGRAKTVWRAKVRAAAMLIRELEGFSRSDAWQEVVKLRASYLAASTTTAPKQTLSETKRTTESSCQVTSTATKLTTVGSSSIRSSPSATVGVLMMDWFLVGPDLSRCVADIQDDDK